VFPVAGVLNDAMRTRQMSMLINETSGGHWGDGNVLRQENRLANGTKGIH